MDYEFLGRTGVRISQLGLGTMSFGTAVDETTARAILTRSRDAGINFIDTADVYTGGRAEELLGRLITDCRNELVIATKGYFPTGDGINDRGSSRYHLVRAVEASLRRLGTDRIDLYFLHRFDDNTGLEETLRGLEQLIGQGKILYPAVSNFTAWQTVRALGIAERYGWTPIVCVQPMYNLVKRQAEVEILPMAEAEKLAVVPYSPLGGGLLSGKYGTQRRPDKGRLVELPMYQTRYGDPSYYETAGAFCALANDRGVHPASLSIAWVGSHPAVTAPIIGANTLEHLELALAATEIEMNDDLRAEISALAPTPPPATDRNEEGTAANMDALSKAVRK